MFATRPVPRATPLRSSSSSGRLRGLVSASVRPCIRTRAARSCPPMRFSGSSDVAADTLVGLCRQRACELPERLGYAFQSDSDEPQIELTFGELDRRARAIAVELGSRIRPGARAILHYPPGLEFVCAFF